MSYNPLTPRAGALKPVRGALSRVLETPQMVGPAQSASRLFALVPLVLLAALMGAMAVASPMAILAFAFLVLVLGIAFQNLQLVERTAATIMVGLSMILGYGFANVGLQAPAPLPLADLLLIGLLALALADGQTRLPRKVMVPLTLFALLICIRLVFDIPVWGTLALRDASIALELFTVAVAYRAGLRDGIERWAKYFAPIMVLVLGYSLLYPWRGNLQAVSPIVGLQHSAHLLGDYAGVNFAAAAAALYFTALGRGWKRFIAPLVMVILLPIFQARSLYIFFPLALLLLGLLMRQPLRILMRAAAVLTIGLLLAFAIGSSLHLAGRKGPVTPSFFTANAQTLTGAEGPAAGTITDRESFIHYTLRQWTRTPGTMIAGVGLGPDLTGSYQKGARRNRKPHDDYLEILAREGILGLSLYVWLLVAAIAPVVRTARREAGTFEGRFCAWVCAAVLIYLGGSAVQPLMAFPYGTMPTWFLLGLGLAVSFRRQRGRTALTSAATPQRAQLSY